MIDEVFEKINEMSSLLPGQSAESESLGRLSDQSAAALRDSGVMRMLQLKEYGGLEAHPSDFYRAVMATASQDPSAGWIAGVVGVHTWEAAFNDKRLLDEIWGDNPDVWMSSPYMAMGIAKPTDGGYIFNGRWPFSSGCDHCDWVVLGAQLGDEDGAPAVPPKVLHIMLPRADYEIIEGSWDVVGLQGTGSKDVVVKNAFIPGYRALDFTKVLNGESCKELGSDNPIYGMPWSTVFPGAIAAAVQGICEGGLNTALAYQKERVATLFGTAKEDPYVLSAIGEAAAEIYSSRVTMLHNIDEVYDMVAAGKDVPPEKRAQVRRDQVRGPIRAVRALNKVFTLSGGRGLHRKFPMHRFWRDANCGLNHAVFTPGAIYHASAALAIGHGPEAVIEKAIIG